MASADDAHSRPKRPAAMARQSSSQSHLSQSPVEGHGKPAHHKAQRHHVVGQRERVQRNASVGKNLNKLNKAAQQAQAQAQAQAADSTTRHHRRSHSGASLSAPSSPRPSFKRNASSGTMRKNHSSGHLAHKSYTKHAVKSAKGEIALAKRSSRSRPTSPERPVAVHFAMAGDDDDDDDDDEAGDDGWTEESASQSPTTTRSNTRSNSVVLEAQHKLAERNMENNRGAPVQPPRSEDAPAQAPPLTLTDRTRNNNTHTNGGRVQPPPLPHQQHSRPADADIITSRLLQRSASHHTPAQTSTVAATVVPTAHRRHLLGGSAGSTLVDTPGRDLVSRFMDGDGSAGTPHDGVYMPSPNDEAGDEGNLNGSKRNQSMPNVSGADRSSKTPSRSGATTPTNLPPSRTQQKLMLQRASSVLEPQKLVPVTLPRTGGPTFLQSGLHYNANGEGRVDPRLQQQFNHVTVEYKVVRRYRNPLGDSIARIQHTPGLSRKTRLLPVSASAITTSTTSSSFVYARSNPASPNASFHHAGGNDGDGDDDDDDDDDNANIDTAAAAAGVETSGASALRGSHSHASFEGQGRHVRGGGVGSTSSHGIIDEGDGAPARQSFESSDPVLRALPSRDVAEEICRRLWESAEMVEAD